MFQKDRELVQKEMEGKEIKERKAQKEKDWLGKRIVNEKEGNTIHDARKTSRGGEGKIIKTESVKGPPGPLTDAFFKKGDPFFKLGQLLGRQKASQKGVELKRKRLNSIAKAPKDGMKTPADDSNDNLGKNVEARLVRNDWAN